MGCGFEDKLSPVRRFFPPILFSSLLTRDYSRPSVVSSHDAWPMIRSFIHTALQDWEPGILLQEDFQTKIGLLDSIHPSCYEDFKETAGLSYSKGKSRVYF